MNDLQFLIFYIVFLSSRISLSYWKETPPMQMSAQGEEIGRLLFSAYVGQVWGGGDLSYIYYNTSMVQFGPGVLTLFASEFDSSLKLL